MVAVSSSCPGCRHASVQATAPGSLSVDHGMPWATYFRCSHCGNTWFMCFREGCTIPPHKNILVSRHHLHRHARHWHGRALTTVSSARDICDVQEEPIGELDEPMEDITPFANQDFDDTIDPALHSRFLLFTYRDGTIC